MIPFIPPDPTPDPRSRDQVHRDEDLPTVFPAQSSTRSSDFNMEALAHLGIIGTEGLTGKEIADELRRGGRFVVFQYCVSLLVITILQPSGIYFLRAGQSASVYGGKFTIMSLFLGWWGFPWGPIRTIQAMANNGSGIDVTESVLANVYDMGGPPPPRREWRESERPRSRPKKSRNRGDDYGSEI